MRKDTLAKSVEFESLPQKPAKPNIAEEAPGIFLFTPAPVIEEKAHEINQGGWHYIVISENSVSPNIALRRVDH